MNRDYQGQKIHLGQWLEFLRAYKRGFDAIVEIHKYQEKFGGKTG